MRDELVRRGVDPELLAVRWVGSAQPMSESCTGAPEGPDLNRRVTFEVWICPTHASPCGRVGP